MANKAPSKRLSASLTFNGKRYYVKAGSKKELTEKLYQKRRELEAATLDRENPTLNKYYDRFTDHRRSKVYKSQRRRRHSKKQHAIDQKKDPLHAFRNNIVYGQ